MNNYKRFIKKRDSEVYHRHTHLHFTMSLMKLIIVCARTDIGEEMRDRSSPTTSFSTFCYRGHTAREAVQIELVQVSASFDI